MRYTAVGSALALAGGIFFLLRPGGVAALDAKVLDALTWWAGPGQSPREVAIVELDERTLAKHGQWPWKRDRVGQLVERILERGATLVALDMLFPEEAAGSESLANAMAGKPVVIGYVFGSERGGAAHSRCAPPALRLAIAEGETVGGQPFFGATNAVCSAPSIAGSAAGNGFLNIAPDSDGTVRRAPLLIEYKGQYHGSLPLAATIVHRRVSTMRLRTDAGGARELRLDRDSIGLEGPSLLRLRFRGGARRFAYVSAAEVLEDGPGAAALRGKIVVVGITAAGLSDRMATPLAAVMPGVELQATAIDNMVAGDYFRRPISSYGWELLLVLLAAGGAAMFSAARRQAWNPPVTGAVIVLAWVACGLAASGAGHLVSPLPATAAGVCNFAAATMIIYWGEKRRADRTAAQLTSTREQTQAALRESAERYRQLVENINDAITVHDCEGRLQFANWRFREWFGLGDGNAKGAMLGDHVAPEWRAEVLSRHRRVAAGESGSEQFEFEGIRADGGRLWIEALVTTVVEDGRVSGTQSALRDVTERKKIEAQYLQAQKMDSLGRLAGGVAHDFNNLLTVINGYAEFLLSRPGHDEKTREDLTHISHAGARAAELTQKLLAFSRQQVANPKAVDLNALAKEAAGMYARLMGEDIELVLKLSEGLGKVSADPGQVNQILINLIANARDAMPTGGRLLIETKPAERAEDVGGAAPEGFAYLGVTDTGIGMSDQVRDRIFEPFYTTKEAGKGTGLGLSTVHGIVRQSGGWIRVNSELGKGSTFHVYLPLMRGERSRTGGPAKQDGLMGSETVLLVEDDAEVRRYSMAVLELYGYRVLPASDGQEALEVAKEYPEPIHLLVSDVVLPKMSGMALAEHLKTVRPETRVLFASGYPAGLGSLAGWERGHYLQKPFSPEMLAARVREVLSN